MDKAQPSMPDSAALIGDSRASRPAARQADFFSADGPFFPAWFYWLLKIGLGGIFLWSGIGKLINPLAFALLIEAYGIIPEAAVMPIAYGLPIIEVAAGLGLWFDLKGSLMTITALLLFFMAILGYGVFLGLDIDCGCFGPDDPEGQAYHGLRGAIYRDMAMLAAAAYIYAWRRFRKP
jgi:uncharacterized membrane protein YphA (DoxX/SURF4 family)